VKIQHADAGMTRHHSRLPFPTWRTQEAIFTSRNHGQTNHEKRSNMQDVDSGRAL